MSRISLFLTVLAVFTMAGLYGCNSKPSSTSTGGTTPAVSDEDQHDEHDEHADHDHDHGDKDQHDTASSGGGENSDMQKMHEALAKLPEADRASAEKQHFCPVTGEMLGLMGPPIKVDVKGQVVWLCCEGCKKELLKDPEKYLAKLNKK